MFRDYEFLNLSHISITSDDSKNIRAGSLVYFTENGLLKTESDGVIQLINDDGFILWRGVNSIGNSTYELFRLTWRPTQIFSSIKERVKKCL